MVSNVAERMIKTEDFPLPYFPDVREIGRYCVAGEFLEDLDAGYTVVFWWQDHCYSAGKANDSLFKLFDWEDCRVQIFASARQLLEQGSVCASVLQDVILNVMVESID